MITATIDLKEVCCAQCGVLFAIPETLQKELLRTHASFYCPNGHYLFYPDQTDKDRVDRLQKELNELKATLPKRDSKGKFIRH